MNKAEFLKQHEEETNIEFESRVNKALETIYSNNRLRYAETSSSQIYIQYETIEAKKPVTSIIGFKASINI